MTGSIGGIIIHMEVKIVDFSAAFITKNLPESQVPCGTCADCCSKLAPLLSEEEAASGKYAYTLIKVDGVENPVVSVPRAPHGGCMYLVDNKCSIYETRPRSCRQFDCRKPEASHPKITNKFQEKKMKLNIGCGDDKYENYISIDYDANCNPDYCLDIEKDLLPFEDNTVDEVIIHHVLEHLGEGYFHFMKELYRVCKHGAMIDILVPHHRHEYFHDDPTHRRAITVPGMWLFSKKYNDTCKQQNARASRLGYYYGVDFEVVEADIIPDPKYAKEFEGKPANFVQQYIHEHNNIIMEVKIKLVAIKND